MAGRGPAPKPSHLRTRRHKRVGAAALAVVNSTTEVPEIPNPDGREWHPLTLASWRAAWESPMAAQWLESDVRTMGRLALLWDQFYGSPDKGLLAEIRLQEARFGLSPLDRTRLSWEMSREGGDEGRRKPATPKPKASAPDPRAFLRAVKA